MQKETLRIFFLITLIFEFGISLISSTYVLYLYSRGLNTTQIHLVQGIFIFTQCVMQIPIGIFADVCGRKFAFVCSCLLHVVSMLTYATSTTFSGFALAEFVSALAVACAIVSFQAWVVDRMKHAGYTGSFHDIFAREQQLLHAASIVGAMLGAGIASQSVQLPWFVAAFIMLLSAFGASRLMKEEYMISRPTHVHALKNAWNQLRNQVCEIKSGIAYSVQHPVVRWILAMNFIQFLGVQAANMQWQPIFSRYFSSTTSLGPLFAGMCLASIIGAGLSQRILKFYAHERRALVAAHILIGVGIICTTATGSFSLALTAFLVHEIGRGASLPIRNSYFHAHIPSKNRAALISIASLSQHFGGIVGLVISGLCAEYISMGSAWFMCGSILIGATILVTKYHK